MPQVIRGRSNIGAHRLPNQLARFFVETACQQVLDGRTNQVDDRSKITRLVLLGALQLFQCRHHRAAIGVPQDDDQPRTEMLRRELDTAHLRWRNDVARNPDDEQVAQTLIEDDLDRYPGIGASEYGGEWFLPGGQFDAPGAARRRVMASDVGDEAGVPVTQQRQRFEGGNHRSRSGTSA